MTTKQIIDIACSHAGISQAEMARRIGISPSNFNQKIRRDSLTPDEWAKAANAVNGTFIMQIRFDDGMVLE